MQSWRVGMFLQLPMNWMDRLAQASGSRWGPGSPISDLLQRLAQPATQLIIAGALQDP
jgi:hypothetical protein